METTTQDWDQNFFWQVYAQTLDKFNPERLRIYIYRKSGSHRIVIEKREVAKGVSHTVFFEEGSPVFYESSYEGNAKFRELMSDFDKVEVETDGIDKEPSVRSFGSYGEFIEALLSH